MNIHHLELFYYVAQHGGIAEAVRKMPYGIQQPAISVQLIQLEKSLGSTLFRRRPFQLTDAGKNLFGFIEPFFSGTSEMAARIRGESEARIRIGASQIILRDYLPKTLSAVRKKVPKLRVVLREGYPHELLQAIDDDEIDIAITSLELRPPAGFRKVILAKLHPQLLFPISGRLPSAETLGDCAGEPLIALPPGEPLCRVFQKELKRRRVDWSPTIEVSSLELVASYVREGFGIGLSFAMPGPPPDGVKLLTLHDFPPITIAAVWRKLLSPAGKILVQVLPEQAVALRF
ncbi:MAG TPA: LysR family transcriptional regulator [Candidatus Limnocylindria bacterium]|nr:LysR family transcriptional regulator [Candidatus Limnocylindria bacterium]